MRREKIYEKVAELFVELAVSGQPGVQEAVDAFMKNAIEALKAIPDDFNPPSVEDDGSDDIYA